MGGEALVRLRGARPAPAGAAVSDAFFRTLSRPLYVRRTVAGERVFQRNRPLFSWEADGDFLERFPERKSAGASRIVVIGESSAWGLGKALHEQFRGDRASGLEIVNCAVGGIDFSQLQEKTAEALRFGPDAVVLLFGHNLFLDPPPSILTRALRQLSRRSALVRACAGDAAARAPEPVATERRLREWESFVDALCERSRAEGFALFLCTVPSNLDFPPRAEEDRWDRRGLEAEFLAETGQPEQAAAALSSIPSPEMAPWWRFRLAQLLRSAGRWAEAREQFLLARDADRQRNRASTAVNETVRRAAARHGVACLDFDRLVTDHAPRRIPGWESFFDNQHVNGAMTIREVRECARVFEERGWVKPGTTVRGAAERSLAGHSLGQMLGSTLGAVRSSGDDGARSALIGAAEYQRENFLSGQAGQIGPAVSSPEEHAYVLTCFSEAFWRAGRRRLAEELNDEALRLFPGQTDALFRRGLFRLREGKTAEAAAAFARVTAADPGRHDARFFQEKAAASRPRGAAAR